MSCFSYKYLSLYIYSSFLWLLCSRVRQVYTIVDGLLDHFPDFGLISVEPSMSILFCPICISTFPVPKGKHLPLHSSPAYISITTDVIKTGAITLLLLPPCPSESKVGRTVMKEGERERRGEREKGKEREGRKWVPKRDEAKRSNEWYGRRSWTEEIRLFVRPPALTGPDCSIKIYLS